MCSNILDVMLWAYHYFYQLGYQILFLTNGTITELIIDSHIKIIDWLALHLKFGSVYI